MAQPEFVGNIFPSNDHTFLNSGNTLNVFVQVFKSGVTEAGGQGANISCEIRVRGTSLSRDLSFSNATPVIATIPMTYNTDIGNNDEYQGTITAGADGRYSYECACSHNGNFTSSWDYNAMSGQLEYFTVGNYDTYRSMLVVTVNTTTYYDRDKFQPGNTELPATIGGTHGDRICSDEQLRLGGEVNIFKAGAQDVTATRVHYSIDGVPQTPFNMNFRDNCGSSPSVVSFPTGGSCVNSDGVLDQRWDNNTTGGIASPDLLTGLSSGEHTVTFEFQTDHALGTETTGGGSFNFFKVNLPSNSGCAAAALPVLLDQFSAKKNKENVDLNWQTYSELNNDYFIVERSKDAKNWQSIGEIKGNGTTNEKIRYHHTDEAPLKGLNFYRLMQVDMDGTSTIHDEMVSVQFGQTEVVLYPNPARDNISLLADNLRIKHLAVYDWSGKEVPVNVVHQNIDISHLISGAYLVKIETEQEVLVERFIKQ